MSLPQLPFSIEFVNKDNTLNTGVISLSDKVIAFLENLRCEWQALPDVKKLSHLSFPVIDGRANLTFKHNTKPNQHTEIKFFDRKHNLVHRVILKTRYPLQAALRTVGDENSFTYTVEPMVNCLLFEKASKVKLYLASEVIIEGSKNFAKFGVFTAQLTELDDILE